MGLNYPSSMATGPMLVTLKVKDGLKVNQSAILASFRILRKIPESYEVCRLKVNLHPFKGSNFTL